MTSRLMVVFRPFTQMSRGLKCDTTLLTVLRCISSCNMACFIMGSGSVNKQDLSKNLKFFNVPDAGIQSIYSKLKMRVFDIYANILKYMYSTRFSGSSTRSEASPEAQPTPILVIPLIHTIDTSRPDEYKRRRKENHEAKDK
jgi:hypothetical protein